MAEDGEYVQNGDVQEWQWAKGKEPAPNLSNTGGWAVPEPDYDPRSAPAPLPSPAEGTPVAEAEVEEEVDLETLTKAELVDMAADAGLDSTGTKADLIERLAN